MARIRDSWAWNDDFRRLFIIVPSTIGLLVTVTVWTVAGWNALWGLVAIPWGCFFWLVFGFPAKRINALREKYADDSGEITESLMQIGGIQAPGLVILRDDGLELIPIVGDPQVFPFDSLEVIKEGHALPGKYIWGKHVFYLKADKRVAFGVPEPVGERWSKKFTELRSG